jgi:addiction module RelE/StbE family toxin
MKIEWAEPALSDLDAIFNYIQKDSGIYANRYVNKIFEAVELLQNFPEMGRKVPEADRPDIRELILQSYRIMYQVDYDEAVVLILAIVHSARDIMKKPHPWEI